MERKDDIQVNDGGGLYDSAGFIDTMILDCNVIVKQIVIGNYIAFCNSMSELVKKLALLKDGITKDREELKKQIKELVDELEKERTGKNEAGSVYNPLEGTVGDREESLRDVIAAAGGGLERDQDHAGA